MFSEQFYGYGAVNGGLNDGVNSGLISQEMWENNYMYYYVDCTRKLPVEATVPMSLCEHCRTEFVALYHVHRHVCIYNLSDFCFY